MRGLRLKRSRATYLAPREMSDNCGPRLSQIAFQPLEFFRTDFAAGVTVLGHIQRAFAGTFVAMVVACDCPPAECDDPDPEDSHHAEHEPRTAERSRRLRC